MFNVMVKTLCELTGAATDTQCEQVLMALDKAVYAFYTSLIQSGVDPQIADKFINIIF